MTIKKINYSWILIFTLILCISFVFTANAQVCQEGQHKFKVTLMHKAGEHTPGERVYTCEICGYTYSEEISPTGINTKIITIKTKPITFAATNRIPSWPIYLRSTEPIQ